MGWVYKARQPRLDRLVALKVLSPSLASEPAFAERFAREARVLARLNHPNIVAVYDFGQAAEYCYLVMEFVDGVNLRQAMRAGGFTPDQALALVPRICEALQYAHGQDVLHRDIKPENILLDAKGGVKIVDFGIAKFSNEDGPAAALTGTGAALGTPHYMAPEQLERPSDVDHRADIYSLGVVFYEMLTGELPLGRFAPPSQKAAVDPRVDDVVLRALEKERERRFQSAGEVKTQVETISANPNKPSVPSPSQMSNGAKWSWPLTSALLTLPVWLINVALLSNIHFTSHPTFLILAAVGNLLGLAGFVLGVFSLSELRRSSGSRSGAGWAALATWAIPLALLLRMRSLFLAPLGNGNQIAVLMTLSSLLLAVISVLFILWLRRWGLRLSPRRASRIAPRQGGTVLLWILVTLVVLISLPIFLLSGWVSTYLRTQANPTAPPMAILRPYPNDASLESNRGRRFNGQLLTPPGHVLLLLARTWSNGVPLLGSEVNAFLTTPLNGGRADSLLSWSVLDPTERAPWNVVLASGTNFVLYPPPLELGYVRWLALAMNDSIAIPEGGAATMPILRGKLPNESSMEVRLELSLIRPSEEQLVRLPEIPTTSAGTNWAAALTQSTVITGPK